MAKSRLSIAIAGALFLLPTTPVKAASPSTPLRLPDTSTCPPQGELSFICGVEDAEDLALVPGGDWLVASGMGRDKPHGALHLINVRTKAWRRWFPDTPLTARVDLTAFPDCQAPPDPARFWSQGLSLRPTGPHRARLLVAGHGEREAIEVFDVDTRGDQPQFTWRGCLRMPAGLAANSVSTTPSGTVLASVLFLPGKSMADNVERRATGAVYRRDPGDTAFRQIPGTRLPGDNGLEATPDGEGFFIVAWGLKSVLRFSLAKPDASPDVVALPFHPDNIHWNAIGQLVAAGMSAEEPACGGPFRAVEGKVDLSCHRGYQVAAIDPATLAVTPLASGPANPAFSNASTGLIVGDTLWLGSFRADRLAYRRLSKVHP
jgi:hypothetical protein